MQKNYGGGEKQLMLLVYNIMKYKGFSHVIVCPRSSFLYTQCEQQNIPVKYFHSFSLLSLLPYLFIFRYIRSGDIIHAHDGKACAFAFICKYILNFFKKNIRVIAHRRVNIPVTSQLSKIKYSAADKTIAISCCVKNTLIQSGLNEQNISIIYSCATPCKRINIREAFNIDEHTAVVVSAARFERDKGIYDILSIAEHVLQQQKNVIFILFGTGNEYENIADLVIQKKLEQYIRTPGFTDNVESFFSSADVYLSCSYNEGLGTSVINALASNTPVVAYNVGGISETVEHSKNGFLIDVHNKKDAAEKLLFILQYSDIRKKMSLYCAQNKKFSVEHMVSEHYRLYSSLK